MSDQNAVKEYRKCKEDFRRANAAVTYLVKEVFAEYRKQKMEVSTSGKWYYRYVKSFSFKGTKVKMELQYNGTYGYSENTYMSLPDELLIMLERGDTAGVSECIAEVIRKEGVDMAERAEKARQKKEEASLMSERQVYDSIQAKYKGVRP